MLVLGMPAVQIVERDHDATTDLHRTEIAPANSAAHGLIMDPFALCRVSQTEKGVLDGQIALLTAGSLCNYCSKH